MPKREQRRIANGPDIRSMREFRERFFPRTAKVTERQMPEPEAIGARLAKESLSRLEAALSLPNT